MPMKVQHHLSLANAVELSRMSNVRHLEIITSIMNAANDVREWFLQKFRHLPSQSTISESLSKIFEHLDTETTQPDVKRQRTPAWVDLENALFEWQQRMEKKKATVTGDLWKGMASVFWDKLPQYEGQPKPKFSTGWLEGFKARHIIKKYRLYGEAGAVDMVVVEEELREIREIVQPYDNENVYIG